LKAELKPFTTKEHRRRFKLYANWIPIAEVHANLGCGGMAPSEVYANLRWVWEGVGLPRFASGCESLFVP
jgi:hypothetical protein